MSLFRNNAILFRVIKILKSKTIMHIGNNTILFRVIKIRNIMYIEVEQNKYKYPRCLSCLMLKWYLPFPMIKCIWGRIVPSFFIWWHFYSVSQLISIKPCIWMLLSRYRPRYKLAITSNIDPVVTRKVWKYQRGNQQQ